MLRNFNVGFNLAAWRSPQFVVRAILGVLLVANLVAAALVLFPPGGSAEDLEHQRVSLEAQLQSQRANLERTRKHASAVEKGRSEGDQFMADYFLNNRTAFSTLLAEMESAASQTKLKPREHAYSTEPIEGSDTLSMLSITAAYEGKYPEVMRFVHEMDRSPKMLIIESMSAAPQQNSDILTVTMKLDTFVREEGSQSQ